MATFTFTDVGLAQRFIRFCGSRDVRRGFMARPDDWKLRMADRISARLPAEDVGRVLALLRAKPKDYSVDGAFCEKCGTRLTAPESIAARVGPECMAK